MDTPKRDLQKAVKEHGSVRAAALALGIPRTTFRRYLKREKKGISREGVKLTEEELIRKYSPEHKVLRAAQQIPKGIFIPEVDFIRGIRGVRQYKHIVVQEKFDAYRGTAPGGIVYWGEPSRVKAMKEDGVLT